MGRPKRELKINVTVGPEPMSSTQQAAAERMLSELIVRAYLADHAASPQSTPGGKRSTADGPADEPTG